MGRKKKDEDGDPPKTFGKKQWWLDDPCDYRTDLFGVPQIDVKDIAEEIDKAPPLSYFKENIKEIPKPRRTRRKKTEFDDLFKDPLTDLRKGLKLLNKKNSQKADEQKRNQNNDNNDNFGLTKTFPATKDYSRSVNLGLTENNKMENSSKIDAHTSSHESSDNNNVLGKDIDRATPNVAADTVTGEHPENDKEVSDSDDYSDFKIPDVNKSKKVTKLTDKKSKFDVNSEKKKRKKEKKKKYKPTLSGINKELKEMRAHLEYLMKKSQKYPSASDSNKLEETKQSDTFDSSINEENTDRVKMPTDTELNISEEKGITASSNNARRNEDSQRRQNDSKNTKSKENELTLTQRPVDVSTLTQRPVDASPSTQRPVEASISTQRPVDASISTQRPDDASTSTQRPVDASISTPRPGDASTSTQRPVDNSTSIQQPGNATTSTQRPDDASTLSGFSLEGKDLKEEEMLLNNLEIEPSLLHSKSKTQKVKSKSKINDTIKSKKGKQKERNERKKFFNDVDDFYGPDTPKKCDFHSYGKRYTGFQEVDRISESNTMYGTSPMPLDDELLVDPDHSYQKVREKHIANFIDSTLRPGDGYVLTPDK